MMKPPIDIERIRDAFPALASGTMFLENAGGSQVPRVVADGVAYAPHRAIDVSAWDVDWYAYSTYKVYGPHMAALYGREDAA